MTLLVYLTSMLTILDIIITVLSLRKKFLLPYVNNHRLNYDYKHFVDRKRELDDIIKKINVGERIIYVSGRIGIGKTQFLHKLIDTIHQKKKILITSSVYPLYIDLKEGEDLKEVIKAAIQVKDDLNNSDLLKELHKVTKAKSVILLIDNANKRLYLDMEEFIYTLVELDCDVSFIIVAESLEEMYKPIQMGNFTENEVNEIATIEDVYIDEEACKVIVKKSGGLPSIIRLLLKQLKLTGNIADSTEIKLYIEKICDNLDEEQHYLISLLAYYSLIKKQISQYELGKYQNTCTEHNLSRLDENGLVMYNPYKGTIIISDYFAQIIREIYVSKRFEICNFIYSMLEQKDKKNRYKLIFLLLSNSNFMSQNELLCCLTELMSEKRYQFLIYLFDLLKDFHKLNKFYDTEQVRKILLHYYTHSLLELGEYQKAQEYINDSEIWNNDINLKKINSQLDFDFNFDLADMDHFFGNFEIAIDSYMKLKNSNISTSQSIKCQWAIGHCYRHMGDMNSMNIAINCFKEIVDANDRMNSTYYIRAYQSIVLIKLFLDDANYDYEKAFTDMIEFLRENDEKRITEIITSRQYAIYHRLVLHNNEKALEILFLALKELEKTNIRIKYDYYFEAAETLRHKIIDRYDECNAAQCLDYYNKALSFAMRSGDISLKCVSQLGIILCNLYLKKHEADDLEKIIDICNFCTEKKIVYIFNYAYKIKDYLLNDVYLHDQELDAILYKLINMNLFIM